MKKLWIPLVSFILFSSLPSYSQSTDSREKKSSGFFFAAPGAMLCDGIADATLHFGGGGEGLIKGGLGISADIGYLFYPEGGLGSGVGVFSPGLMYQFRRERKTSPFLIGGYSVVFREGAYNLIHFGGGFNYWLTDRLGLRVEARDHMEPRNPEYHVLQVRVGLSIR